jgi:Fur family ferric uptake transcriptional regulator
VSRDGGADPGRQLDTIRARGERLTPQRLMVLDAVRDLAGHQTAEAIFAHVRLRYPYANLATIYRALAWLKEQALVSETDLGGGQIEYEFLGERRHHHLVCLRCGMQAEFGEDAVVSLAATLRERYDFEPRIDHLAIFGVCRHCRGEG